MTQQEIVEASKKTLSNYFTGKTMNRNYAQGSVQSVSNGLGRRFKIKMKNHGTSARRVAITPAYFDVSGFEISGETVVYHRHNITEIVNAGFNVDAIIDDNTTLTSKGVELSFASSNAKYSIRAFLDFIRTNPMSLKELRIISKNGTATAEAFSSEMEISTAEPFNGAGVQSIDLAEFFDAYQNQNDRIKISFTDKKVILDDQLIWIVNLPASADLEITMDLEFA